MADIPDHVCWFRLRGRWACYISAKIVTRWCQILLTMSDSWTWSFATSKHCFAEEMLYSFMHFSVDSFASLFLSAVSCPHISPTIILSTHVEYILINPWNQPCEFRCRVDVSHPWRFELSRCSWTTVYRNTSGVSRMLIAGLAVIGVWEQTTEDTSGTVSWVK